MSSKAKENRPRLPIAVALAYDESTGQAPKVVATGKGEIAQAILDTASDSGVPVEENAALAAALSDLELDEQIPEELFQATAEIIAFVLRHATSRQTRP